MKQASYKLEGVVSGNLNIRSWHLIERWAQLSKLIAFNDLILWKISQSSILY